MDLTLLPAPVSEYNKQGTGARFTVRSASSPSYSLNRRPGLRRRAVLEKETKRENREEVPERERDREEVTERERDREEVPERERDREEVTERERDREEVTERERDSEEVTERERDREEVTERERDREEVTEREREGEEVKDKHFTQKQAGTNKEVQTVTKTQARTGNRTTVLCEEKGTSDHKVSRQLNQNGTGGKVIPASGTDKSGNCSAAAGVRGRSEWRSHNLSSRSKSLDWRGGASGPDQGTRVLVISSDRAKVSPKRAESLERSRDRFEGTGSTVMSRVKVYNSTGTGNKCEEKRPMEQFPNEHTGLSRANQAVDKAGWGQSLPSRLRPQSGSGSGLSSASGLRETSASLGPKGGQSIWERIEKLYRSTESGKTEDSSRTKHLSASVGAPVVQRRRSTTESPSSRPLSQRRRVSYEADAEGTFPRRSSVEEKTSSLQNNKTDSCTPPADASSSVNPADRPPGGRRQGQSQVRRQEDGDVLRDRGVQEMGTRSLDRARSKFTVAAQIRSVRAAGSVTGVHTQPHTLFEEETSNSSRDLSGHREGRASGSKDEDRVNSMERKGGLDDINDKTRERTVTPVVVERLKERDQERGSGAKIKEENGMKSSNLTEDVFESSTQKISLKTTEGKKFPEKRVIPSAASVRNKIHQYEALTQRIQSSATNQFHVHRRAFSVPAPLSGVGDGVKKSGSGKEIGGQRDGWEGLREGGLKTGEEGKVTEGVRKCGSGPAVIEIHEDSKKAQRGTNLRSTSLVEVGVRRRNGERRARDVGDREGTEEVGNNRSDDFGKYSRLKDKLELEIPLNTAAKTQNYVNLHIDETDFCKATSPDKSSKTETTSGDAPSSTRRDSADAAGGLLGVPELSGAQSGPPSGVPLPGRDNDRTPTNTPRNSAFLSHRPLVEHTPGPADGERQSTPVSTRSGPTPGRDSLVLPDLVPPAAAAAHLKGEERDDNLDTWVASWNQKIEGWSDDDDDEEGTEKDENSNYDSDSADSSVTITSNMSQSDRRSFCVSLAELCNFSGAEYESDDSDEWSSGRRSASLSSDMSALSCVSVLPSEELDKLLEDVRGLGDTALQNYNNVKVVVLHKEVGVGLGFSMAGGLDQNKPITVHRLFPSGVAAQEGSIQEGDQVLSINGTALCGSGHWEALRTLKRAKTRGMGVVVLRRGGGSTPSKGTAGADAQERTQTQSTNAGQRVCVRLEKQSRDLGFSLEGGVGWDKPLSIQKIFQGGPVNEVYPGDEVREIQGVSVVGMRRLEAWNLIRRLPPGPVEVVLHRPLKPQQT
ncbi:uncharacterized protein ACJ7VT_020308 [Polymixia lowei]